MNQPARNMDAVDPVNYPSALKRAPAAARRSNSSVIDARHLPKEMKNLIRHAAYEGVIPNCDLLLYHDDNFTNWQRIAAEPRPFNEVDAIMRASRANALIMQPPETLGFLSIGPGDMFKVKERAVMEAHLAEGHGFSSIAYSEINRNSLNAAMDQGKQVVTELALKYPNQGLENIAHIPLLGDTYEKATAKFFRDQVGDIKILAGCFGFTMQNVGGRVNGYTQASEQLTNKLKFIKDKYLSRGSRLLATFDHDTDRQSVLSHYTGEAHDDFTMSAVAHHLGAEIAAKGEIKRRFSGSTAILNREVVAVETMHIQVGSNEIVPLAEGSTFWSGVSAKSPESYIAEAYERARLHRSVEPVYNGTVACHVYSKPSV